MNVAADLCVFIYYTGQRHHAEGYTARIARLQTGSSQV